jgi:alkaline phosphatase D
MNTKISRRNFLKSSAIALGALALEGCTKNEKITRHKTTKKISLFKLAAGSCLKKSADAKALNLIVDKKPNLFVWLGDNIYADTTDMTLMKSKYNILKSNPNFQKLFKFCPNYAIWDDHDYGENNAGEEYTMKAQSQEIFLNFWEIPSNDERRQRPGIYHSQYFGNGNQSIQLIQLDNRYFRSTRTWSSKVVAPKGSTMLGETQWAWLTKELSKPSAIKIITSGIEILSTYRTQPLAIRQTWEGWDEFPDERNRLYDLIKNSKTQGVIFLSGDQHFSELNKLDNVLGYPAYELCTSSLDQGWYLPSGNNLRQGTATGNPNFGMIQVDWSKKDPEIRFQLFSAFTGKTILDYPVSLGSLYPWSSILIK